VIGGKNVPYLIIEVNQCGYDFFKSALYGCGVVVTPGEAFRANNCIRISCLCLQEDAHKGAKRLAEFLKNL
jgi:aspartate/methionine/tyrosine aminotransferase